MSGIEDVEDNLKKVLKHWGFGEICASIYAFLALSDSPLTAMEIAEHIGYAYTTTINALNRSIDRGHIRKMRKDGKNVYYIDSDLSYIIKENLSRFLKILEETEKSIKKLDDRHRMKLDGVLRTVNDAIKFLKKMEAE